MSSCWDGTHFLSILEHRVNSNWQISYGVWTTNFDTAATLVIEWRSIWWGPGGTKDWAMFQGSQSYHLSPKWLLIPKFWRVTQVGWIPRELRSKSNNKLFGIYQINVHAEAIGTQLTMEMFYKSSEICCFEGSRKIWRTIKKVWRICSI